MESYCAYPKLCISTPVGPKQCKCNLTKREPVDSLCAWNSLWTSSTVIVAQSHANLVYPNRKLVATHHAWPSLWISTDSTPVGTKPCKFQFSQSRTRRLSLCLIEHLDIHSSSSKAMDVSILPTENPRILIVSDPKAYKPHVGREPVESHSIHISMDCNRAAGANQGRPYWEATRRLGDRITLTLPS